MAQFQVTGPDGSKYNVTAPDDASDADVMAYVQANAAQSGASQKSTSVPGLFDDLIPSPPTGERAAAPASAANMFADLIPSAASPAPPSSQPEMRAYNPTWRDQLGQWLADKIGGDHPSPEVDRLVSGLVGSTGLGDNRANVIDLTPARIPLLAQEATRAASAGDYGTAAADAFGALPVPVSGKIVDAAIGGGAKAIDAVANLAKGPQNAITDAADLLDVDVPRVAAMGDGTAGRIAQNVAGKMTVIPVIGTPISKAADETVDQLRSAAEGISQRYLQQPNAPLPAITDADPAAVGDTVKDVVSDWIGGKGPTDSPAVLNGLYRGVDALIPPTSTAPLPETTKIVQMLLAKDDASHTSVSKPAIDMVADAINDPNGLTFAGMKDLRTAIGAKIDDGLLPDAGTTKPALKLLYGGLTKDLDATVAGLGGHQASAAWDHAETVAKDFSERREELTKIIGNDGGMNAEGVVDRLVRYAGSQSTADFQKLALARRTLGANWDDVSAAAIQRLGRNQSNEFDPGHFLKNYEALSENGRSLLFGDTGKKALKDELDALATISSRYKTLQGYRNTSGTGGVTALLGAGAALSAGPPGWFALAKAAIPSWMLAKWMAQPVRVRQLSQLANTYYNVLAGRATRPTLQLAVSSFARHAGEDTGENPHAINSRMQLAVQGRGA